MPSSIVEENKEDGDHDDSEERDPHFLRFSRISTATGYVQVVLLRIEMPDSEIVPSVAIPFPVPLMRLSEQWNWHRFPELF